MIAANGYATKHSFTKLKPYTFERDEAGAHVGKHGVGDLVGVGCMS
jgi:hypothetical protein